MFGGALSDDLAAGVAGFGAHVDEVVGFGHDAGVVFDDDDGEAFIGEGHAFNSALYLIAGVGNTEFADDSHFTVNVGAGYRFLVNDWVALHVDFRDHIFDSDLLGTDKTTHNLEATAGVSLFF